MIKFRQHIGASLAVLAASGLLAQVAVAKDELVTVGSRTQEARSVVDSPVPIDVISTDDLNSVGNAPDLTENLRQLVPSFTATPATGDGSAFVRPTSLRGTAPDQTLVLVNGKRRHRSALIQFLAPAAGNGAHGPDIGMLPGIAIKRVEVLRDGASSQYGSDAIAGVINFITKDAAEGGQVFAQYGQHFDGEQSYKVAANGGFAAGDNGFINVSLEYNDNEGLSRGFQRGDAQGLIDAGRPDVGADAIFDDAPLTQSWSRPKSNKLLFFLNSGFEISDSSQLYAQFGYGDTEGTYRFFYRNPDTNAVFTDQLPAGVGCPDCAPGTTASLREQDFVGLPGGFTPFLDGEQTDASIVLGVKGEYQSGLYYDYSVNYGRNQLDYFLNNSANQYLGPGEQSADGLYRTLPQMNFNVGAYKQEEISVNADWSLPLADNINLAFGAEWRQETYSGIAGEPASYFRVGSSGLKGISPEDAGEAQRDNVAIYADIEHDITDSILLQYAVRYEDYSDFGDTFNGKLAARWRIADPIAIRGAVSTGFHAPTPGQSSVRTSITTFDSASGLQTEELVLPPTDDVSVLLGGKPLQEETSVNYSLGFTWDIGALANLTIDAYRIDVDDRIYKTGDIVCPPGEALCADIDTVAFFTNALDVEHTGVDVVFTMTNELLDAWSIDWTLAANWNDIKVTSQKFVNTPTGPVQPVSDATVEDIENNFPTERGVLTMNNIIADVFNVMLRANYYGSHYDERGTIAGNMVLDDDNNPVAVERSFEIGSTVYIDLDIGWQVTDFWRVNVGGVNIFDEFVDTIGDAPPPNCTGCAAEYDNRVSVGLPYPRRSAANYEGGFWYLNTTFTF